jgi:hypothetical protein
VQKHFFLNVNENGDSGILPEHLLSMRSSEKEMTGTLVERQLVFSS